MIGRSTAMFQRAVHRRLLPREHGAYGQLLVPLAVAYAVAGPSSAGAWLTLAAVAGFAAHEPTVLLLGQRGARGRRELGAMARQWLWVTGGAALASGLAGAALAPPAARWSLALPIGLAFAVGALVLARRERSTLGLVLVASALPALAVPIEISGGLEPLGAYRLWVVWTLGTSAASGAVRAIVAHRQASAGAPRRVAIPAAVSALAVALFALGGLRGGQVWALVPLVALGTVVALAAPHPRHLRRVGWSFVGATLVTAWLLCLGEWDQPNSAGSSPSAISASRSPSRIRRRWPSPISMSPMSAKRRNVRLSVSLVRFRWLARSRLSIRS